MACQPNQMLPPAMSGQVQSLILLRATESDFLTLESIGLNIKRCAGCNYCKDCNWHATHLSYMQNRKLSVIEALVTFDEAKRAWFAEYLTVEH